MHDLRSKPIYLEGPCATGPLSVAVALTQYSEPPDTEAGRHRFSRTQIGTVLHDAKYGLLREHAREAAQATLTGLLIAAVNADEHLRGAAAIVAVPGSTHDFAQVLADDVGIGLGLPVVVARRRSVGGHPAKWRTAKRDYEVPDRLDGPVLVIDDFFRSGTTMRAVAFAALQAGATDCRGLVVAHTPQ
jgi:predicted amidophosphoribosyltransferase